MLKKVWTTEDERNMLMTLTLESEDPNVPVHVRGLKFPAVPTPEYPLRHTTVIGPITFDDAEMIVHALSASCLNPNKERRAADTLYRILSRLVDRGERFDDASLTETEAALRLYERVAGLNIK